MTGGSSMARQPRPGVKTRRERDSEVWREVDVRGYTMMERARWGEGCVGCSEYSVPISIEPEDTSGRPALPLRVQAVATG